MRTPGNDARVKDVKVGATRLTVALADGRSLSVPLSWFPRLRRGTPAQRRRWEPCGGGAGIHWPDLDEDVGVAGLLRDVPSHRGPGKAGR